MDVLDQQSILDINQAGWDVVAPKFYGATALPDYGPFAPSEDELRLLGDVEGKRVLELGCGSGHSLLYLAQHGAAELWGLDLAPAQIASAATLLQSHGVAASVFVSPMEENPGVPLDSFDLVISVYALGWTAHLDQTIANVATYLKPGGRFVFSWEHPLHHCLQYEGGRFVFDYSYQQEGPRYSSSWLGVPIVRHARKVSTFVNALLDQGLMIERIIEPNLPPNIVPTDDPERYYSAARAALVPATFIVRARKP